MNEEEKQAIEKFVRLNQKHLNNEKIEGKDYLSYWEGFLITNLIDNQQKEIERIKNFNYNTYIRKDTIRHIRDKAECMDYYSLNDVIDDLSKLLGDKNNE